ncbi:hypothetical protein [Roseixanthobacter glucoisosaccharinicivorans]|uniref:hypothetical protein n=1 Tax=Roseixanthobacter glucoisosaccharinicivorans TaxID=3119923 RepID=UPI00372802D9
MKFPDPKRSPYYIVAPRYTRMSAGIKCLHLLCHMLNLRGERAFFSPTPLADGIGTHPDLLTPLLTEEIVDYHFEHGARPIVIYPEVVSGNPFDAETVVRYVLNFPGFLGGDTSFPPETIVFGYTSILAEFCGAPDNVLFLPHVDTRIFSAADTGARAGTCYTAIKYKYVHGGEVFGIPPDCIEITRDQPDSHTIEELAALFRKSEVFYCFENTSLSLEATLCGCPTILMPNPFFEVALADKEIGRNGVAWGDTPEQLAHAKATVHLVAEEYRQAEVAFERQLSHFIDVTQAATAGRSYSRKVRRPLLPFETGEGFKEERARQGRAMARHPFRLAGAQLLSMGRMLLDRSAELKLLRSSRLFDARWYLEHYPDIARMKVDPVRHYLLHGADEDRDPGPFFSTRDYYALHRDLKQKGVNPLVHYLRSGQFDDGPALGPDPSKAEGEGLSE